MPVLVLTGPVLAEHHAGSGRSGTCVIGDEEDSPMLTLLIIGLLAASLVASRGHPKTTAIIDFAVAMLLLIFRVIPGVADGFDWILMIVFFLSSLTFYFRKEDGSVSHESHFSEGKDELTKTT